MVKNIHLRKICHNNIAVILNTLFNANIYIQNSDFYTVNTIDGQ